MNLELADANNLLDRYTVVMGGHYDTEDQRVACPHCRADEGLTFYARPVDASALASCTCGYEWWDERISGEAVRDLFLAMTGQPTRTTSVRMDGQPVPRQPCAECSELKAECQELSLLASAADGAEQAELRTRTVATLGAWGGHLASHFPAARESEPS